MHNDVSVIGSCILEIEKCQKCCELTQCKSVQASLWLMVRMYCGVGRNSCTNPEKSYFEVFCIVTEHKPCQICICQQDLTHCDYCFRCKGSDNACAKCCLKCCICCLWCLEKCMKYLNQNAYTIIGTCDFLNIDN